MKKSCLIVLLVVLSFYAYSEATNLKFPKGHTQITKKSILATFMDNLTEKKYKEAFSLIHPKLGSAWTLERFKKDWEEIRKNLNDWKPEATSFFTGQSPNGTYIQATYRLESSWKSLSSVDLMAMPVNGEMKIVKIHIRTPYKNEQPQTVKNIASKFISAMKKKDYESVQKLMTAKCQHQFPPNVLACLQPILGNGSSKTFSKFYRLNANSVWYDVVNVGSAEDIATFIELIISSDKSGAKICTLSFKGRIRN